MFYVLCFCFLVFIFIIICHIDSWFITFVELGSAFSLELIERISIKLSLIRANNQPFTIHTLLSPSSSLMSLSELNSANSSSSSNSSDSGTATNNNTTNINSNKTIEIQPITTTTNKHHEIPITQDSDDETVGLLSNNINNMNNLNHNNHNNHNTSNGSDDMTGHSSLVVDVNVSASSDSNDSSIVINNRMDESNIINSGKSCSKIEQILSWIPRDKYPLSYIMLALNLILSRGLSTVVLQYYDMDYPTYAICRNSKMVFVMFLSVFWLKKSYNFTDWILVVLTSLSVLCFRVASHDLLTSKVNTIVKCLPLSFVFCLLALVHFGMVFAFGVWKQVASGPLLVFFLFFVFCYIYCWCCFSLVLFVFLCFAC